MDHASGDHQTGDLGSTRLQLAQASRYQVLRVIEMSTDMSSYPYTPPHGISNSCFLEGQREQHPCTHWQRNTWLSVVPGLGTRCGLSRGG